ncbi:MAG: cache domain-containing protein [Bacteroidetes bacterium]|nr:cache domain-containing protein [Bacteroidota bacterium]
MLDRKREMINELTNSAWSILDEYYQLEQTGGLTRAEAQENATAVIKDLRYGDEGKDYFWITDQHPTMIMHPYREELNNTDLSNYQDPEGKKLFVDFVKVVKIGDEGFVDYMWQWKDDSTLIVPKLSFVKGFTPWGWIIGTGIYIEDVKEEISNLTGNLIYISFGILSLLGVLLFFVTQQSLKIEHAREEAEDNLIESEAKYRALVEASTEGLVMMLDNEFVYANNTLYSMFGIEDVEAISSTLEGLLCGENNHQSGKDYFTSILSGNIPPSTHNAQIIKVDGKTLNVLLTASPTTLGDKSGYSIIIKDISTTKQIEDELGESEERYKLLTNNIRIGVFRTTVDRKNRFIELNPAAVDLLGYNSKEELLEKNLFDFFYKSDENRIFQHDLLHNNSVNNFIATIVRRNNTTIRLSISAVIVKDESGDPVYCDGILEDVTEQLKMDEEREKLIVELQSSLHFLNEPISRFIKSIVSCDIYTPIINAAAIMTKMKYSAILITASNNKYVGIVTDRDLRERAIGGSINTNFAVSEVMTSPIISINENALVFEAYLTMFEKSTRHLAVKDSEGNIISMISSEELLQVQRFSSTFLLKQIESSAEKDLPDVRKGLPLVVKAMVESGAKPKTITKTISSVSDTITSKLIRNAIDDLGEPPAKFAFIALGSQGREEQTLFTDQDNAIIIDDSNSAPTMETILYFHNMADRVIKRMYDCGYELCKGESMANNPKWCQPLSKWKEYFKSWITNSNPQDLLELSIFFDFRFISGERNLSDNLRDYLFEITVGQSGFFQHLTRNCLEHTVPLNMLGNLVLESKGDFPETFNIKTAIMPIADFARIYSLLNKVGDSNTLDRLTKLQLKSVLNKSSYNELVQSYNFLMQLRLKHQVLAAEQNRAPNNSISPDELTQIELKTLKNIFTQITAIQKRLSAEFTGEAL